MAEKTEQPEGPEEHDESEEPEEPASGAHDDVDPETRALARRAHDAVLKGDYMELASVLGAMPKPAGAMPSWDTPGRPGARGMRGFPARSGGKQASSGRWVGVVAGVSIGVAMLGAIGFGA